jgi:hypothetical protein
MLGLALTPTDRRPIQMVDATQSYRKRMKAARAKRQAAKAEWVRSVELMATARMMALDAVKRTIRGRGDRVTHYTHAQLGEQADEMAGTSLFVQACTRGLNKGRQSCLKR